VKRERLDWLADNPLYTKRFAFFVGRRCRETAVKEVAEELFLDWHTVKELDKQYMREQLRRAGNPAPRVIGSDEIAIAKGHHYRIVVSDLERGRPIWFGGTDRSEESLDEFFRWLGPEKCRQIRLAVMDMGKAFRNSTLKEGANRQRIVEVFPTAHRGGFVAQERQRIVEVGGGADRASLRSLPSLTSCRG
jgi:transposase